MPSSSTVRAIYRCLLRDARELQRTPHFNIRRELQLEQWGTGGFVESLPTQEQQEIKTQVSADPRVLKSLEQFRRLRDDAFRMGSPSVDLTKSIQEGFRENMQLSDPKVATERNVARIASLKSIKELTTICCVAGCERKTGRSN